MKDLKAQIQSDKAEAYDLFGQIETLKRQAEQQLSQMNNKLSQLNFNIASNSEKLKQQVEANNGNSDTV
jgi:TolA-binding protein